MIGIVPDRWGALAPRSAQCVWILCWLVAAALVGGCAPLDPPTPRAGEDPLDLVHFGSYESANPASRQVLPLASSAHHRRWFPWFHPTPRPRIFPPIDKVHEDLRHSIATLPPTTRELLVVTFEDTLAIGPFDRWPVPGTKRDSAFGLTADRLIRATTRRINLIEARRAARYAADSLDLATRYGATVLKKYWLLQAFLVEMPIGLVDSLSRRPGIAYIRPDRGNPPPQTGDQIATNDVESAGHQIGVDHYQALGLTGEWMALLDSGIETQHILLCGTTSSICMVADAMTGVGMQTANLTCNLMPGCQALAGGDLAQYGHGTASAAILVGNDNLTSRYHGITETSLDCVRVFDATNHSSTSAALSAFDAATQRLNRVMVVEMQEQTLGDIADATERAFKAGVVVIAANGNDSALHTAQPASSPLAIGVGAYDVRDEVEVNHFSAGPTWDGRNKPDIIGPTYTETAGYDRTDPNRHLQVFGGTSGSTPYVAGAAAMVSDWLRIGTTPTLDPGQVYAALMLSGDRVGPFLATNRYGAGRIKLPPTGSAEWGKTWVSFNAPTVDIPVDITSSDVIGIEAAIWWPEATVVENSIPIDTHSDVNLVIRSPGLFGSQVAVSDGVLGVFERVAYDAPSGLQQGTWLVRVHGASILRPPQVVYWGVRVKKSPATPTP